MSNSKAIPGRAVFTKADHVGRITLENLSRMNAISFSMWREIAKAVAEYESDPSLRCLVVRGAGGKAFASGADISEFDELRTGDVAQAYDVAARDAMAALEAVTKPTIAMIEGFCIGGGLALALCCDLRLAADDAQFAIPAARLGLGYRYIGIKRLVDFVGPARAKLILFSARRYDAQQAKDMGLIEVVCQKERLREETDDLVANIVDNAPLTLVAAKHSVVTARKQPHSDDITASEALVAACFASEDYAEGRRAFAEKRRPNFRGR
jgi:enoyl-CoA hydratase/carnithine racemase